ncbi:MAG: hypothetical protein Ta2D_03910 [Rickettsiales bacterium]|nr:MAG: hypothetical protein Ta2D_03910 [Rickettsiales bacterium]
MTEIVGNKDWKNLPSPKTDDNYSYYSDDYEYYSELESEPISKKVALKQLPLKQIPLKQVPLKTDDNYSYYSDDYEYYSELEREPISKKVPPKVPPKTNIKNVNKPNEYSSDAIYDRKYEKAYSYLSNGNYEAAAPLLKEYIDYIEKKGDIKNPKLGNAIAFYGNCLYDENIKIAARYYKQAAKMGNIIGMNNYGNCLFKGKGVDKNEKKAAFYHKQAADNVIKIYDRANHLLNVEKDKINGEIQLKIAQNNAICLYNYGNSLLHGKGVEKNELEAIKYFKYAQKCGNTNAINTLKKLENRGEGWDILTNNYALNILLNLEQKNKLKFDGLLGRGGSGLVCQMHDIKTNKIFAVKIPINKKVEKDLKQDIEMSNLIRDNITDEEKKLFTLGVTKIEPLPDYLKDRVFIMKKRESDLLDLLKKSSPDKEQKKENIAQMTEILNILHDKDLVCPDFKLQNILYNGKKGRLELTDLASIVKATRNIGKYSITFFAPENARKIIEGNYAYYDRISYNKISDSFLLGIAILRSLDIRNTSYKNFYYENFRNNYKKPGYINYLYQTANQTKNELLSLLSGIGYEEKTAQMISNLLEPDESKRTKIEDLSKELKKLSENRLNKVANPNSASMDSLNPPNSRLRSRISENIRQTQKLPQNDAPLLPYITDPTMLQDLENVKKTKTGFFKTTPSLSSFIMNNISTRRFDTDEKRIDALLSFIIINKDTDILNTKKEELRKMFNAMMAKSPDFIEKVSGRIQIINNRIEDPRDNDENIRLFKEGKNCGNMFNTLKEKCAQAKELGQTGRVLKQK